MYVRTYGNNPHVLYDIVPSGSAAHKESGIGSYSLTAKVQIRDCDSVLLRMSITR